MSVQGTIDDHVLGAYLDGELAAPEAEALERAVAEEPELAARLRELAFADAMLRASMRALETRAAAAGADRAPRAPVAVPFTRRRVAAPLALAASLVVAVGAGVAGYSARPLGPAPGEAAERAERVAAAGPAAAALQAVLEQEVSGTVRSWSDPASGLAGGVTPVRSWQDRGGRFCREFDAWRGTDEAQAREHGIACRDDTGRWRVRVRYYPE